MTSFELMDETKDTGKIFGIHWFPPYLLFLLVIAGIHALAVGILPMADIARAKQVSLTETQSFFQTIYTLFNAVLIPLMTFGIYRVYLVFARKQRPAFSVLFDGYYNFIRVWILFFIKTMLVAVGLMLFVIPGILMFYNTAMAYFIFSDDEDMAPWAAVSESFRLMKGNRFRLFKLQLSFLGWFLLVLLTLGLALIYVGPYYMTALAKFYDQIRTENEMK